MHARHLSNRQISTQCVRAKKLFQATLKGHFRYMKNAYLASMLSGIKQESSSSSGMHYRTFFVPVFLQTLRLKYRMLPSCRFFLPDILKLKIVIVNDIFFPCI